MRIPLLLTLTTLALVGCEKTEEPAPEAGEEASRVAPEVRWHPGRVLVGHEGLDDVLRLTSGPAAGVVLRRDRHWPGLQASRYVIEGDATVPEVLESVHRSFRQVRYAEPDFERHMLVNDTYRYLQWNLDTVDAEAAWAWSTGSGTVVAVIDSGVSSGSADGIGAFATGGYDYVNNDADPADDNGHGTHVAGTIAQATDNGAGVAGLAYDASILAIKVLDQNGSGWTSDVVSGIQRAESQGADVINLSLGSSSYSATEAAAVLSAHNAGIFVAAATGNAGASSVDYPAGYTGAVGVGATDYNDTVTSYSNTGSGVDLVAPGGDTTVDDNGDGYVDGILQETFSGSGPNAWGYYFFDGTSMATPHVAAAAALLMAQGASSADAESYLISTATDLGITGRDDDHGHGLIQPAAALAAYDADNGGTDTSPPPVDTAPPVDTSPPVDTAPPAPSCVISITKARYSQRKGELTVWAISDDFSWDATLFLDGVDHGAIPYKSNKARYETKVGGLSGKPTLVEVVSDCGASDATAP